MTNAQHLSWDNFKSTVLVRGEQRLHRIRKQPAVEIFADGNNGSIGLWLELGAELPLPPELSNLVSINSRVIKRDAAFLFEVSTKSLVLQRQFYHFAMAVAERVIADRLAPLEAVAEELKSFSELLVEKPLLGLERQIGLIGELLFLERLMAVEGMKALDAWIGPLGEPHDFRYKTVEFEVKTTVSPRRVHTIHGPEQLVPSQNCSLLLVSFLLGPPGASTGISLTDKVAHLSDAFGPATRRRSQFISALEAYGFRTADRAHYIRRFAPRRPMALVRVDQTFPAITRPTIQRALGPLASRVESLQYDVDVEGLELEEGTPSFVALMPAAIRA